MFSYDRLFLGYFSFVDPYFSLLVFFCFSTKRALYPFSPWLPAAIAAPTPISSLVHSSTLVTAGLYLIIRHRFLMRGISRDVVLLIGVFTSFYAGVSSLVEVDLKKVVALSTLSHLGFITMAISLGWEVLAFMHLLAHALFKSILFISLGGFIVSSSHIQDSRFLSSFFLTAPLASSLVFLAEGSLLGFPFFGGFYSKDVVLEVLHYSLISYFLLFIIFLNVIFTFMYRFRVLDSVCKNNLSSTLSLVVLPFRGLFVFFGALLAVLSVLFGGLFSLLLDFPFVLVSARFKFLPFFLLFFVACWFLFSYSYSVVFPLYYLHFFSGIGFLVQF